MSDPRGSSKHSVSVIKAALLARCPRCCKGQLYQSLLNPAKQCSSCRLDYSFIDTGDGPAVFVIFIFGFVLLGLALVVETIFHLPLWLHAILWTPLIIIACLLALRFAKALMIALQFKTTAGQAGVTEIDQS